MDKIKNLMFLTFFSFIILLSSCGKKGTTGKKITLNMWIMPNSSAPEQHLLQILEPFKEKHPEIDIVVTVIDWGSAWSKITTAAIGGTGPDICQIGTTWSGTIASMGVLMDLTEFVNKDIGIKKFVPAAWQTSGIDGKVTAIPWFIDARAVFYRKDIFDKLGLTAKDLDTWEEFEKTLEKLQSAYIVSDEKGNIYLGEEAKKLESQKGYFRVYPIGVPGKNDWNVVYNFSPWIWSAGGDWLTSDKKDVMVNSEKSLKGIWFYTQLAKKYAPKSALELNTMQVEANFANGKYAVITSGSWVVRTFSLPPEEGGINNTLAADKYAVTLYPKGPAGRYTFLGGSNLVIFKNTKYPKEAWEVIKYLVSKKAQVEYVKYTGFVPATIDAYDTEYFDANPNRKVFKEAIKYGRVHPCVDFWAGCETILFRRLGILWDYVAGMYGEYDYKKMEELLNQTAEEMKMIIKSAKK